MDRSATSGTASCIVERVADGEPIGIVGWHAVGYGPNAESSGWNIGIALLPEARGHGHGTDAQALLAAYLFENTDVNRIEAQTDVDNIAEQRSLEKAGFVREGTARGAQFRRRRLPRPRDLRDPSRRNVGLIGRSDRDPSRSSSDRPANASSSRADLDDGVERSAMLANGRRLGVDPGDRLFAAATIWRKFPVRRAVRRG